MSLPADLATHIRAYLTSSDVDLQTVSAKQIRKQLATIFPDLDIKALRTEIDEISVPIFHQIREESEAAAKAARKPPPPAPTMNPVSSKPGGLALPSRGIPGVVVTASTQLPANPTSASEPNGSSQATPATSQRSSKPTPSKAKKRKSAAYVDSEDEDDRKNGAKKTKKPRKSKPSADGDKPASTSGIHQELNCSTALAELIGVATCSRPQVVKKLWAHIKAHDLQNPKDKREIICDAAFKKVFNVNTVHMFTMNKLLGEHLHKDPEAGIKP